MQEVQPRGEKVDEDPYKQSLDKIAKVDVEDLQRRIPKHYRHGELLLHRLILSISSFSHIANRGNARLRKEFLAAGVIENATFFMDASILTPGMLKVGFRIIADTRKYAKLLEQYLSHTADYKLVVTSSDTSVSVAFGDHMYTVAYRVTSEKELTEAERFVDS